LELLFIGTSCIGWEDWQGKH